MLDALDPAAILRRAQGILAETSSRVLAQGSSGLTSGTAFFTGIPLRAGTRVSNISIGMNIAGAAITLSKLALHTKAGILRAVSADQGTGWHSTGIKTAAMTTPYVIPVSDMYYVTLLAVYTSTQPFVLRAATFSAGLTYDLAVGSGALPTGIQTAQADMPSPATIVASSTAGLGIWAAIT
jgi:hypothetical protein